MAACAHHPNKRVRPLLAVPAEVRSNPVLFPLRYIAPIRPLLKCVACLRCSISTLVKDTPSAAFLRPGDNITNLPCFSQDAALSMGYYGSDVAFGQFAGGNQLAGLEGLGGAMAAAGVVGFVPNQ